MNPLSKVSLHAKRSVRGFAAQALQSSAVPGLRAKGHSAGSI